MSDPLSLAVLGGAVATQAITFLFDQAAAVLAAWRERRKLKDAGEPVPDRVEVPVPSNDLLDGTVTTREANLAVVEGREKALAELYSTLTPYGMGVAPVEVDDAALAEAAGRLRALLEDVYGERLTFRGEDRQPTGAAVNVRQKLGQVSGSATATAANAGVRSGILDIDQQAQSVDENGSITAFKGTVG